MSRPNWENRTLFQSDNLDVLRGMNKETVDLIATDPPFKKGRDFHATPGSLASGARFQDRWSWETDIHQSWVDQLKDDHPKLNEAIESARQAHSDSMGAYLCFMAVRLVEMHRILKSTGNIYLHCDTAANHYLKAAMDAIFGAKNFRDEIVWQRASGRAKGSQHKSRTFGQDCDYILHYSVTDDYKHNEIVIPLTDEEIKVKFPRIDSKGRRYNTDVPIFRQPSMGPRPNLCYTYKRVSPPHPSGWRVSLERLKEMDANDEIIWREGKRPLRKSFAENYTGKPLGCLWTDITIAGGNERTGYPTQKPVALYKRIIEAGSDEGDIVLDPFAGCATTCVAAELLKRQWVGIDFWDEAEEVLLKRMDGEGILAHGRQSESGRIFHKDMTFTTQIPEITEEDTDEAVPYLDSIYRRNTRLAPWQKLSHNDMFRELAEAQERDGKVVCAGCGRVMESEFMQLDHITPRSGRGANDISNRILLCGVCNRGKSNILTLPGLHQRNKKMGWMQNASLAKHAQRCAQMKYEEIRDCGSESV